MVTKAQHEAILAENRMLKAELAELRRVVFARRSERFIPVSAEQPGLFDEVDQGPIHADEDVAQKTKTEKPKPPGRNPLPQHFEVVTEIIAPNYPPVADALNDEGELISPTPDHLELDGHVLIGFEHSRRVAIRPTEYYIIEQKRPKYRNIATGEITVAHAPDRVLARSIADETLATDIIVKKCLDHLPLYRQAAALKRDHDWTFSRATMGKVVDRVAVTLRPLYNKLVESVLASDYLQMDETRCPVQSSDKPGKLHLGQMWLVRDPRSGQVIYRYDKGRSAQLPTTVLAGFNGVLQTDGHSSYTKALKTLSAQGQKIRQVGCLAHIRRYFFKALASNPEIKPVLKIIQQMYALEATWADLSPNDRLAERKVQLAPVFDKMTKWLNQWEHRSIPGTLTGKAIGYALKQWPSLEVVLEDGRIKLDNNGVENDVRPYALGRKNYLFAGNHGAAQNLAVLYSLLLCCRAVGVNPRDWLNDTLKRILSHPVNRIDELLPSNYGAAIQDVVG